MTVCSSEGHSRSKQVKGYIINVLFTNIVTHNPNALFTNIVTHNPNFLVTTLTKQGPPSFRPLAWLFKLSIVTVPASLIVTLLPHMIWSQVHTALHKESDTSSPSATDHQAGAVVGVGGRIQRRRGWSLRASAGAAAWTQTLRCTGTQSSPPESWPAQTAATNMTEVSQSGLQVCVLGCFLWPAKCPKQSTPSLCSFSFTTYFPSPKLCLDVCMCPRACVLVLVCRDRFCKCGKHLSC